MTFDAAFVPKLAKKARLRFDRIEERWMIVYPERGLALNESGAAIAQKCDGTRTLAEIVDELSAEHGAPRDAIEQDVRAFLEDLAKKRLLAP